MACLSSASVTARRAISVACTACSWIRAPSFISELCDVCCLPAFYLILPESRRACNVTTLSRCSHGASERPALPLLPFVLTGVGFWGSSCVPSPVSGIRMPKLPLLPFVGAGGRGIGGKGLPPLPTTQDATAIRSQPPQSASTAMPALSRAPLSSTAPADTPG